jgi:hypothetical protein
MYLREPFGDDLCGEACSRIGAWARIADLALAEPPAAKTEGDLQIIGTGPASRAVSGHAVGLGLGELNPTEIGGDVGREVGTPELVLPMMSFAGLVHVPLLPTVERTIAVLQVERRHPTASTRHFVQSLHDTPS